VAPILGGATLPGADVGSARWTQLSTSGLRLHPLLLDSSPTSPEHAPGSLMILSVLSAALVPWRWFPDW
jgi:hypothetical protein